MSDQLKRIQQWLVAAILCVIILSVFNAMLFGFDYKFGIAWFAVAGLLLVLLGTEVFE